MAPYYMEFMKYSSSYLILNYNSISKTILPHFLTGSQPARIHKRVLNFVYGKSNRKKYNYVKNMNKKTKKKCPCFAL